MLVILYLFGVGMDNKVLVFFGIIGYGFVLLWLLVDFDFMGMFYGVDECVFVELFVFG